MLKLKDGDSERQLCAGQWRKCRTNEVFGTHKPSLSACFHSVHRLAASAECQSVRGTELATRNTDCSAIVDAGSSVSCVWENLTPSALDGLN